jgi:hypothetical protein
MSNPEIPMNLFLALVYLARIRDKSCPELEHYELDYEVEVLMRSMSLGDRLYLKAAIQLM